MSELQKREAYRYFAFVSYSSNDGAVAKKLQHQIETYRLPTVIRNELEAQRGQKFPPRLTPIFRDMTDLPPDVLGKSLLRELEDSKYLIVICSPHSALSTWVNLEIENFILMGRYEQIILYLIDGEPNSANPAREAFPPILRKNREYISYASYSEEENRERQAKLKKILAGQGELKAVSIAQEGAYVARMKTVARMLEVKPDDLIQRDKQRQQRQRFQNIGIVAAVLLLIFGFSLYAWDKYYRVHTNYYTDYVERWGVPEGIFELQKSQLQRRNSHYRIEKQAGRVVRLVHANSAGTPVPVGNTEFKDRPMIAEYQYQQDPDAETGRLLLTGVAHKNRNGKTLNWLKYSNDQRAIDFSHSAKDDSTGVKFLATRSTSISRDPFGITTKSETTRHLVQYDESGFTIRREFKKDNLNNPTQDAEGVAGFDYKLDEIGRVVELTYLDVKNQPCPTKIGVARRKYQYDDSGNLNSTEYLDVNGNPARNEHGWICREEVFDADGNVSQTCLHTHAITYSGQRLAKPSFADMVMGIKTAANAGSIKHKYDEQGNKTEEAYFDAYGEPCLGQGGFAIIRYKYDEQGNRTEDAFFGADDEPCLHNDGFAIVRCKYDERGNKTEQAYFEVYSKYHKPVLALSYEGLYAIVRCKYDERGNRVEEAYLGEDGEPCLRSGGYAILRCKCDERGNRIEESHFGVDSEPCLHNDGFAIVRVKYNERGNIEETAYFGVDGKPCLNKDGCAIVRFKCDEQGNVLNSLISAWMARRACAKMAFRSSVVKSNGEIE